MEIGKEEQQDKAPEDDVEHTAQGVVDPIAERPPVELRRKTSRDEDEQGEQSESLGAQETREGEDCRQQSSHGGKDSAVAGDELAG